MIYIVDKNDLMTLTGYSQSQCAKLIRTAKIKLVSEGFSWYKLDVFHSRLLKTFSAFSYLGKMV